MRQPGSFLWPAPLLLFLLLPACDKTPTPPEAPAVVESSEGGDAAFANAAARVPFAQAQVFLEANTTDGDLGLQVFLDAPGWRNVSLHDPGSNRLFRLIADGGLATLGVTELRFESAEPAPAEVLSRFPPGQYTFRGETVDGAALFSRARLSHNMLQPPTFTPRNGQQVDPNNAVVRWNAPGAEFVEVIVTHTDLGHTFDVTVSGTTSRLTIPRQFLRRNKEYDIELLSIARNGNRTIRQSSFRTGS